MATLKKDDAAIAEAHGFEFGELPVEDTTRKSKNFDKFTAAADLCIKYPNQWLKLATYPNSAQPYGIATQINNNDRIEFQTPSMPGVFEAKGIRVKSDTDTNSYEVWVRFVPTK